MITRLRRLHVRLRLQIWRERLTTGSVRPVGDWWHHDHDHD